MFHLSKEDARYSERGSSSVKLLFFLLILVLIGNAGYSYVPTAYQGESFKQDMKTAVIQGAALPSTAGKPVDVIKRKLQRAINNNGLPVDTYVEVKKINKVITARVYYTKKVSLIPLGGYDYIYEFDYTATPGGFLTE